MKRSKKRTALALLLSCAFLFGAAGCGNDSGPTGNTGTPGGEETGSSGGGGDVETVKLCIGTPLSGSYADAGQQGLDGATYAVDYINSNGGIQALGGAQIELISFDTTSDSNQSMIAMERAIEQYHPSAVMGMGYSGLTLPCLPVAERLQTPLLTTCISPDLNNQGYEYIYAPDPKSAQFAEQQTKALVTLTEETGYDLSKVAIVYEDSEYGITTAESNREIVEAAGFEVVLYEAFPVGFTDASSLVTSIKQSGATVLFPAAGTQEAILIVNALKSIDYTPLIIAGGAGFLWPTIRNELGDSIEGVLSAAQWNWDSKYIRDNEELWDFVNGFEEEYGYFITEHGGAYAGLVGCFFSAIEACGSADPVAIRDAMDGMEIREGLAQLFAPGYVTFDETGWNDSAYAVLIQWQKCEDGVYRPLTIYPEEAATAELIVDDNLFDY